jgi:hypothetical protein
MAVARIGSVSLDCADPQALAAFWAGLVGGDVVFSSDDFVAVQTDRVWLSAVRVAGYRPPTWPGDEMAKQIHLDLAVADLDAAQAEAVRLGAAVAPVQPSPERWRVLIDPAGHPFCLTTLIPDQG